VSFGAATAFTKLIGNISAGSHLSTAKAVARQTTTAKQFL
jgi:hypothetical protein